MLEVEVSGNGAAIGVAKAELTRLSQSQVRQFKHRGFGGEAGIFGLIGEILPDAVPALFVFLNSLLTKDRDLKVSIDGNEFVVRDIPELEMFLEMLSARGIVVPKM